MRKIVNEISGTMSVIMFFVVALVGCGLDTEGYRWLLIESIMLVPFAVFTAIYNLTTEIER